MGSAVVSAVTTQCCARRAPRARNACAHCCAHLNVLRIQRSLVQHRPLLRPASSVRCASSVQRPELMATEAPPLGDWLGGAAASDGSFTFATWNILADGLAQSGGWLHVRAHTLNQAASSAQLCHTDATFITPHFMQEVKS